MFGCKEGKEIALTEYVMFALEVTREAVRRVMCEEVRLKTANIFLGALREVAPDEETIKQTEIMLGRVGLKLEPDGIREITIHGKGDLRTVFFKSTCSLRRKAGIWTLDFCNLELDLCDLEIGRNERYSFRVTGQLGYLSTQKIRMDAVIVPQAFVPR